jgi:hypothetical protein
MKSINSVQTFVRLSDELADLEFFIDVVPLSDRERAFVRLVDGIFQYENHMLETVMTELSHEFTLKIRANPRYKAATVHTSWGIDFGWSFETPWGSKSGSFESAYSREKVVYFTRSGNLRTFHIYQFDWREKFSEDTFPWMVVSLRYGVKIANKILERIKYHGKRNRKSKS